MLVLLVLDTRVGAKCKMNLFLRIPCFVHFPWPVCWLLSGLKTVPTSCARIVGTIWMCLSRPFWKKEDFDPTNTNHHKPGFPKTAAVPRVLSVNECTPTVQVFRGGSDLGQLVGGCDDSYDQVATFFWRSWWGWITGTPLWQGGFNESSVNNLIVNTCPKIWRPLEMGIA